MKKILYILPIILALAACSDPKAAHRALESGGFSDIETGGYAWFSCGRDDGFATRFVARNPAGNMVSGTVCSSWTKGSTIRFD